MRFDPTILTRYGITTVILAAIIILRWPTFEDGPPNPNVGDPLPTPHSDASAPAVHELPVSHGDFDYYVLVLSWSPTHCSSQAGHGHDDDMQCRSGRPYGFVLHGLWPQNERGYPQSCETAQPHDVSPENMERMLKVSPSEDLVQHEWQKHGTCSGLSQNDFVSSAVAAYSSVTVPPSYRQPDDQIQTSPDDVREAFLSANPALKPDDVAATCSRNDLAEVWVCLDKSLKPRACSNEVLKHHCGARHVRMRAVRGDWP